MGTFSYHILPSRAGAKAAKLGGGGEGQGRADGIPPLRVRHHPNSLDWFYKALSIHYVQPIVNTPRVPGITDRAGNTSGPALIPMELAIWGKPVQR